MPVVGSTDSWQVDLSCGCVYLMNVPSSAPAPAVGDEFHCDEHGAQSIAET